MRKNIAEHISSEVRAELARQRRPQRDIADVLGISVNQVSERIRGDVEWRVSELVAVADLLGVPLIQFLPAPATAEQVAAPAA
ncbi:helix-turn-helix domain-containing protein [Micromonospora robiginosa]|uniref:Helix-turn-helix transcriptional regulator n=1 Tax=Micromonospora robiginosa TaxID=2749844 RepID=A0A7L6B7W7_9ACTN|nr:helix-turn-helix transcriptional regulator [Micromonospora ferruginea]QLQ37951.1 helix-turn-helix transcriptional regulator [Micromonospora ferruginea]